MKKAFVDHIMLGFFLIATLIVLGATVADEFFARKKIKNLEKLVKITTRSLSKHYMYNENMIDAQDIANDILNSTDLGAEVLSNNLISYLWRDLDSDGLPDVVTSTISGYVQDNFWFRFIDLNTFSLPEVEHSEYITKEESQISSIVMRYGGSNAGYHNMIGTYEFDDNGCMSNAKLILVNKEDHEIGDELGSYTNLDTRFFIIPDGYDKYGNRILSLDSSIEITGCEGDNPTVTIDSMTDQGTIYFQDTQFNTDNGYDHMHELGKTFFVDYENFIDEDISVCTRYRRNGNCREWSTRDANWEDWVIYAEENEIDFSDDPNDEYIITMEDLPDGGDKDFNDINLDTTKIRIPNSVDSVDIQDGIDVSP